jgi:opacity protein-like surface antigen
LTPEPSAAAATALLYASLACIVGALVCSIFLLAVLRAGGAMQQLALAGALVTAVAAIAVCAHAVASAVTAWQQPLAQRSWISHITNGVVAMHSMPVVRRSTRQGITRLVTSCDEHTLQGVIAGSGANDTVRFAYDGRIDLQSSLAIAHDLTLDGSGHDVTISTAGHGAAVSNASSYLTLKHLSTP